MDNSNIKISIEELEKFRGDICVYSADSDSKFGTKIKTKFKELLTKNMLMYQTSLANKNDCKLIIIDGDDFKPVKIAGVFKAYEVPIVVFISNSSKIEKLRECIMNDVLVIDKNSLLPINFDEDITKNLEAKKKRDEEKEILYGNQEKETIVEEKKDDIVETNFFFSDSINDIETKKFIDNSDVIEQTDILEENNENEIEKISNAEEDIVENIDFFNFGTVENDIKTEDENSLNNKEYLLFEEDVVEKKEKIVYEEVIKTIDENNFKYNGKELKKIGCYSTDIEVIESIKNAFGELENIKILSSKEKFDIIIIDITFALVKRAINFINEQNCPTIIISHENSKLSEFKQSTDFDIMYLEKPLSVSKDVIRNDFQKYLNTFDNSIPRAGNIVSKPIFEDDDVEKFRVNSSFSEYKKPTKDSVKNSINKNNKRIDRTVSLEEIYENLGLDDIVIFNSNINKCIFFTDDNVAVRYTPVSYLIEFRIKRLEAQGLPKEEINNMIEKFEKADIKFNKKALEYINERKRQENL